jgi:hypothetical protein
VLLNSDAHLLFILKKESSLINVLKELYSNLSVYDLIATRWLWLFIQLASETPLARTGSRVHCHCQRGWESNSVTLQPVF